MGVYKDKRPARAKKPWCCQVRIHMPQGRRQRFTYYFRTRAEATAKEREILRLAADLDQARTEGRPVHEAAARVMSATTFVAYSERWIASRKAANLRPATIAGYEAALRNHLRPRFGEMAVHHIRRTDVQAYVDELSAQGRCPGGVRVIFKVLSACLGRAAREELSARNPCFGVELPKLRAEEQAAKRRALTADEAQALLAAAGPERWRALFRVALGSGLRQSELGRLRWDDLDLDASPPRAKVLRAKSGRPRTAPLLADAVQALRAWPRSSEGRVFAFLRLAEGGNLTSSSRSVVKNAIGKAARRAGIGHVRFHDLRHTWATYVGMSGVPLEALRSAGGWSNLTLVGHYARCGDEATMAAWREALGGLS